jgi:hypothetical protein
MFVPYLSIELLLFEILSATYTLDQEKWLKLVMEISQDIGKRLLAKLSPNNQQPVVALLPQMWPNIFLKPPDKVEQISDKAFSLVQADYVLLRRLDGIKSEKGKFFDVAIRLVALGVAEGFTGMDVKLDRNLQDKNLRLVITNR